jgi:starvation-inducible DNA-binding protein
MLADELKVLLGSTFVLYTKMHSFHFNVEGPDFPQYHELLNKFYSSTYETIDVIGEYIRTLGSYAPGSLARMLELSILKEQEKIPRAELMLSELVEDQTKLLVLINQIFDLATSMKEQGIANYMAELRDLYTKNNWMLKATLNKARA